MLTRFRAWKDKYLSKLASLAALVSLVTSFFSFVPTLPAVAVEPLSTLTTTLGQPIFSTDFVTDPSYTNVTYSWSQAKTMQAASDDPCLAAENCFKILLDLQDDSGSTTTYQNQEWMSTVVTSDFIWNGPSEVVVSSTQRLDNDGNGRYEQLEVVLGCTAACAMVTSTVYSFDIVNYPIKNQQDPATYVPGVYSTTTHTFFLDDQSVTNIESETLTSVVAVGLGITVTASVDPSLSFSVDGVATSTAFYTDTTDVDTSANPDACSFGTLTPSVPKICAWTLNIATNAANGYTIYVVQDANMASGANTIKQFTNGTRTDDSAATVWSSPSVAQYGHLGYSSDDTSVFPPSGGTVAVWAGIPTIPTASQAPTTTGMVADSASPGDDTYTYALQVESASSLPQGTYTHTEYFMVVGNF